MENPFKMMKNGFYFTLQALYIFALIFLVMQENALIRKIRLISKFMTSSAGKQMITIHILPDISRSKDNQTMKCGQLIPYNMTKKCS